MHYTQCTITNKYLAIAWEIVLENKYNSLTYAKPDTVCNFVLTHFAVTGESIKGQHVDFSIKLESTCHLFSICDLSFLLI